MAVFAAQFRSSKFPMLLFITLMSFLSIGSALENGKYEVCSAVVEKYRRFVKQLKADDYCLGSFYEFFITDSKDKSLRPDHDELEAIRLIRSGDVSNNHGMAFPFVELCKDEKIPSYSVCDKFHNMHLSHTELDKLQKTKLPSTREELNSLSIKELMRQTRLRNLKLSASVKEKQEIIETILLDCDKQSDL